MPTGEVKVDGSMDFSGGVDSIKVTTIQSPSNPDGLARNELAWLVNATVRDGGITPRPGWQPMGNVADGSALYQGGITYNPTVGDPYLICLIGGHVMQVTLTQPPVVTDLSVQAGLFFPANQVQAFFVQAEEFVVIQCGDLVTNPIFYEPTHTPFPIWQSVGITAPYPTLNELPPGGPMVYYHGQIWIGQWNGQHRVVNAGDIVGDQFSGTNGAPEFYHFRDSVLRVTESPLAFGGDGFAVPTHASDIRGLGFSANLDATLGQGTLFVFTIGPVYSLSVPLTRNDWISTTGNTQPLLQVVQLTNGSVNDRSIVQANGDLFYQCVNGFVGSLSSAVRYFQQWGNIPVSSNENRILQRNDRSLLHLVSGINFENRLLMGALPKQLPQGAVCQAIVPLDFTPITSFGKSDPPTWEGSYEGIPFLQLFEGNFGGLSRAFGLNVSTLTNAIDLWELTSNDPFENGDNRISWLIEWPSFDFGDSFELKKLVSMEIWFDRLWGQVDFSVYYRPDQYPCPLKWADFTECAARNQQEDKSLPPAYPIIADYREQYRATKVLPLPANVGCNTATDRPFNVAYQFQPIMRITGFCRIRGILLKALPVDKSLYAGLIKCV